MMRSRLQIDVLSASRSPSPQPRRNDDEPNHNTTNNNSNTATTRFAKLLLRLWTPKRVPTTRSRTAPTTPRHRCNRAAKSEPTTPAKNMRPLLVSSHRAIERSTPARHQSAPVSPQAVHRRHTFGDFGQQARQRLRLLRNTLLKRSTSVSSGKYIAHATQLEAHLPYFLVADAGRIVRDKKRAEQMSKALNACWSTHFKHGFADLWKVFATAYDNLQTLYADICPTEQESTATRRTTRIRAFTSLIQMCLNVGHAKGVRCEKDFWQAILRKGRETDWDVWKNNELVDMQRHHFRLVAESLMAALTSVLGSLLTSSLRRAWSVVLSFIAEVVVKDCLANNATAARRFDKMILLHDERYRHSEEIARDREHAFRQATRNSNPSTNDSAELTPIPTMITIPAATPPAM